MHNGKKLQWPDILQGVLFAYRTVQHTSTKYSPFFVLYQRDPVLPVDLKFNNNNSLSEYNFNEEFDEISFEKILDNMVSMRGNYNLKL